MLELYSGTLKNYWNERRKHVDEFYKNLPLPYPKTVKKVEFEYLREYSIENYVKYVSSWSAVEDYYKKNKDSTLLEDFKKEYKIFLTLKKIRKML